MPVLYDAEPDLTASEFRAVLMASTLAERRPVGDLARLEKMLRNADLIVTARDNGRLVGVCRAITDYAYCCYVSDLAVDNAWQRQRLGNKWQKQGIGKRLIAETHIRAGEATTLLLVAAPEAETCYPQIGMERHPGAWLIPRRS